MFYIKIEDSHLNFISILAMIVVFSIFIFVFLSFIMFGFLVGYKTIYRKTIFDRQKLELSYKVYSKKWLETLNINIVTIYSTHDKIPLRLYIVTPKKNKITNKAVIFHHGITSNHVAGYKIADFYLKKNFTFISYDSRGWGDNAFNEFCTYGVLEKYDLLDVVKYLNFKYNFKELILHGESMGGKSVLEYACNFDYLQYVNGYVIDSGFVNFSAIIKHNVKRIFNYIPYWFVYPFANVYIKHKTTKSISSNNLKPLLGKINSPLLLIYSDSDATIPTSEFHIIENSIKNITVFHNTGAPHVLSSVFYRETYHTYINNFLKLVDKNDKRK